MLNKNFEEIQKTIDSKKPVLIVYIDGKATAIPVNNLILENNKTILNLKEENKNLTTALERSNKKIERLQQGLINAVEIVKQLALKQSFNEADIVLLNSLKEEKE